MDANPFNFTALQCLHNRGLHSTITFFQNQLRLCTTPEARAPIYWGLGRQATLKLMVAALFHDHIPIP
jgi:hypothetical protein